MKRLALTTAFVGTLATLGMASPASAGIIADVVADYSVSNGDSTTMLINNLGTLSMTNVVITSGSSSETIGTIAGGGFANVPFNSFGGPFSLDYDDFQSGESTYVLTGLYGGAPIQQVLPLPGSAGFSPSHNATGSFVGFLGNGAGGGESDAPVLPTVVAEFAVPEPVSLGLLGIGILGLGLARRRK